MQELKSNKDFEASIGLSNPPESWPESLKAMWWDYKGNWEKSHQIAQHIDSGIGNWIHAYLHRKEGDQWNAGYWYRIAGKRFPSISLDEEAGQIVEFILDKEFPV